MDAKRGGGVEDGGGAVNGGWGEGGGRIINITSAFEPGERGNLRLPLSL